MMKYRLFHLLVLVAVVASFLGGNGHGGGHAGW
jgi:hypothetical protein